MSYARRRVSERCGEKPNWGREGRRGQRVWQSEIMLDPPFRRGYAEIRYRVTPD